MDLELLSLKHPHTIWWRWKQYVLIDFRRWFEVLFTNSADRRTKPIISPYWTICSLQPKALASPWYEFENAVENPLNTHIVSDPRTNGVQRHEHVSPLHLWRHQLRRTLWPVVVEQRSTVPFACIERYSNSLFWLPLIRRRYLEHQSQSTDPPHTLVRSHLAEDLRERLECFLLGHP